MDPFLVRGSHAGMAGQRPSAAQRATQPIGGHSSTAAKPQPRGANERSRLVEAIHKQSGAYAAAHQRAQQLQGLALGVAVPWSMFVATELAIALLPLRVLAWSLAACGFAFACILVQVYLHSKAKLYLHLGLLGALAVVVASICGEVIYDRSSVHYWMGGNRASRTNVNPAEPAELFADAGALTFTPGTRVHLGRVFGTRGPEAQGYIFCVAPVMDLALAERGEVHFWAAGTDCCEPLSAFRCGAALRQGVRSGVVISPGAGAGSNYAAFMYRNFNRAAQQAAAMYRLGTPDQPVFVAWTQDVDAALHRGLDLALLWAAVLALLYLVISIFLAGWLHWRTAYRRQDWQQTEAPASPPSLAQALAGAI